MRSGNPDSESLWKAKALELSITGAASGSTNNQGLSLQTNKQDVELEISVNDFEFFNVAEVVINGGQGL